MGETDEDAWMWGMEGNAGQMAVAGSGEQGEKSEGIWLRIATLLTTANYSQLN